MRPPPPPKRPKVTLLAPPPPRPQSRIHCREVGDERALQPHTGAALDLQPPIAYLTAPITSSNTKVGRSGGGE